VPKTAPQPPDAYDVCRAQDGALVVVGVSLDLARSEAARLNAEARVQAPDRDGPTGMYLGELVRYEVRSKEGLVIA
jgi:hypothetical protein